MPFNGDEMGGYMLAAKLVFDAAPIATGEAIEIDAVALSVAVGYFERRRAIRMSGAAAEAI
jgi:hypothetical protein